MIRHVGFVTSILVGLALSSDGLTQDAFPDSAAVADSEAPPPLTERSPEEVESLRETRRRYQERTREFHDDTRAFFDLRKEAELAKISDGYDDLISRLESGEGERRKLAIEKLEDFLKRYPDASDSDNIRFRLAELYYEQSLDDWFEANKQHRDAEDAYDELVDAADAASEAGDMSLLEELPPPPEAPKRDVGKSIRLYDEIIANNIAKPKSERWELLDRVFYTRGFALQKQEFAQYDVSSAEQSFRDLLKYSPESSLRDAARLFLGNILFNETKDYAGAVAEYNAVYLEGPEGEYYMESMFQLAWLYYKLSGTEWEKYEKLALEMFTILLDMNEEAKLESGRESDFAPDARLNMARILADRADRSAVASASDALDPSLPYKTARSYFADSEPRTYERDVMLALGEVLVGCIPAPDPCPPSKPYGGRYLEEEAVALFEEMQVEPRWANHPDNPKLQIKVLYLLPRLLDPSPERIQEARKALVERYSETIVDPATGQPVANPWWKANQNNTDALDTVRKYIEGSLVEVAIALASEAQRDKSPELALKAALKFKEYLDKYPIADDYYVNQWNYANMLLAASPRDAGEPTQNFRDAIREYRSLFRSRRNHVYGDGAIFQMVQAWREVIVKQPEHHGPLDQRPKSAEVERKYTTEWGKEVIVYTMPDDHKQYIAAMQAVVEHPFAEPKSDKVQDFREYVESNRGALYYIPGQMAFLHNRYEEARELLLDVIEQAPNTKEASYAATLIVNTYENEGDLAQVRVWTKNFLGDERLDDESRSLMAENYEDAGMLQCQAFIDLSDRNSAAECFEAYLDELKNPKHENYSKALYNAANSYDIVGKAEKANELFEKFLALYPKDDKSRKLFFRIAGNYEATFDLERAVYFYEQLVKNDPKLEYEGTPDAQYNAAFLKIGMGDYAGAARGFEAYHARYKDRADREQVYYMAGEQWERVGRREAIRFYTNYLREYNTSDPNHALEAKFALTRLYGEEGNRSQQRRHERELLTMFDKLIADGHNPKSKARNGAAQIAFPKVQESFDKFVTGELTGNDIKDAKLIQSKTEQLPEVEKELLEFVGRFGDFEYASRAYYLMGKANLYVAELGYGMECPSSYSEEDCDIWWEVYDEKVRPQFEQFEEKALSRFKSLETASKERKEHNEWVDAAYLALNQLNPFDYPDVKDEIRGEVQPSERLPVRGLEMPGTEDGE